MKLKNLNFWRYSPGQCFASELGVILPLVTVVPVFIFIDSFGDAGAIVLSADIILTTAGAMVLGDALFRTLKKHFMKRGVPEKDAQTQAEIIEKWSMVTFLALLVLVPVSLIILEHHRY